MNCAVMTPESLRSFQDFVPMTSTEVSPIPLRRLKTPIYSQIRRAEDIQVWGNREL